MEIEVMVPVPAMEFNFDSTCSSPYMTAPSSPQRFGNYFNTVPITSSRIPSSYHQPKREEGFDCGGDTSDGGCEDFEFDFSGHLERTSLSAEELFDGGKIRPLRPQQQFSSMDFDAAIETSSRIVVLLDEPPKRKQERHEQGNIQWRQRGRERTHIVHKKTRSLSPFRVSDTMFETEESTSKSQKSIVSCNTSNSKSYVDSILSAISFPKGNGKWKLKDLFLFRSSSENRVTSEDSIRRKYGVLRRKEPEDVKNSSFRSTESVGSVSRRRGPVSAHELHYTTNRAVSEEMKRKTSLPYKQGLLGCLGFNAGGGMHGISRGIGSLTRG